MNGPGLLTLAGAMVLAGVAVACLFRERLHNQKSVTALNMHAAELAGKIAFATSTLDALAADYDALVLGCGAGVIILDSSDTIERASPEGCRLLGTSEQQLKGRSLLQVTLSSELNTCLEQARKSCEIQSCELRTPSAGLLISVSIIPICYRKDSLRCIVVATDITELRRLETVRRDFVANVSHELRTPLTSIRAMAETLQDGALRDSAVADRFLGIISNEAQRLTRISEDLLVLSHAESQPTDKVVINLAKLVSDIVHRFQGQATDNGVRLDLCIVHPAKVLGSADQIEQVVINLVDNAIKYTPATGTVSITVDLSDEAMVTLQVADTGIGIMSQDLKRIFERFYRVDKARSRQSGGTGLGLAIVKHIVEAHGGNVMVQSEYNHGSTFIVCLPAA